MGLAALLGARRKFAVDGVRYRECTGETLRRALSSKGRGTKAFDVTFSDGSTMRIEASRRRRYADIHGPGLLDACRCAQPALRPGMRMVMVESGTGAAGAWAARVVGSAGAVVALDRDPESIEYARKRYTLANVSFELAGIEALQGETDGAFDAALAIEALADDTEARAIAGELWRVLAPGGVLVIVAPLEVEEGDHRRAMRPDELAELMEMALRDGKAPEQVSIFRRSGWTVGIARRRSED